MVIVETGNEDTARSQRLWEEAQVALAEADGLQASEKLWGAAAQAVKGVAEARGWPHGSHRELYGIVERLRHETRMRRLGELFSTSSALHQNFYEEWMTFEHVAERADDVQEFRDALSGLMEPPPGQS